MAFALDPMGECCFLFFYETKKSLALRRRTILSTKLFIYRILVSGKLTTRPFIYHIWVSGKLSLHVYSSKHKEERQQEFPIKFYSGNPRLYIFITAL